MVVFELVSGQVFILGCTNAGKSTLFNALLSSDFCSVDARDILKRATASIWPGELHPCNGRSGVKEAVCNEKSARRGYLANVKYNKTL